jgi:hypothetical protein
LASVESELRFLIRITPVIIQDSSDGPSFIDAADDLLRTDIRSEAFIIGELCQGLQFRESGLRTVYANAPSDGVIGEDFKDIIFMFHGFSFLAGAMQYGSEDLVEAAGDSVWSYQA